MITATEIIKMRKEWHSKLKEYNVSNEDQEYLWNLTLKIFEHDHN